MSTATLNDKAAFERTEAKPVALDVAAEDIPAELRNRPQWVCWQYRPVFQSGGAKRWTKVPIAATTGGKASSTDPRTWSPFNEALAYYEANHSRIDGIGFVFSPDDPFVGVDLDDALDPATGNVREWAQPILADLDSYCEISPSRTGVKMFLCGQLPPNCKHRKPFGEGEVELYDRGRFFVVTGHRLTEYSADVEERQAKLNALYDLVFVERNNLHEPPPASRKSSNNHTTNLDDAALLNKAMNAANGDKFRRLWHGVTVDYNGDDSRADMALCCSLAFWTAGDANRIDSLFRQAGLMREKWDERRGERTYGQMTISHALARTTVYYNPARPGSNGTTSNGTHPDHGKGNANTGQHSGAPPKCEEPSYQFCPITSADFAAGDYHPTWLVKRQLVKGQPCIIGAPKKSLKTTIGIDLSLSLATGTPFLGMFDVYKPVRVCVVSGESGEFTLQETARRICEAKGIAFPDANVMWAFDLPQLANTQHVAELCEGIETHEIEVLLLDPLYLCLLAGEAGQQLDAANLYHVGPLFRSFAKAVLRVGCTPILLHHSTKHIPHGKPMELDELAYAAVAEFARQWMLLNRREPYDPDAPGSHQLWLSVGGSTGQSGKWALDIEEGELQEDFTGRKWDVSVQAAREEIKRKDDDQQQQREKKKENEKRMDAGAVLSAIDQLVGIGQDQQGTVKRSDVQANAGLSVKRVTAAVIHLLAEKKIEEAKYTVNTGRNLKVTRNVEGLRRAATEKGQLGLKFSSQSDSGNSV